MSIKILMMLFLSAGLTWAGPNQATDASFTKPEKRALASSGMILTSGGFGTGTCFEQKNRKIILTAKHVIEESVENKRKIYFIQDGKDVEIKVLKQYEKSDLATLEIVKGEEDVSCSNFLPHMSITKIFGEDVFYAGFPNGVGPIRITGEVANYFPSLDMYIVQSFAWPGASGSAVYDKKGRVLGVVSAVQVDTFNPTVLLENMVYVAGIVDIFSDLEK